jgi:replicative DNA helicase
MHDSMQVIEAEINVVSSLMYDNLLYEKVSDFLKPVHFADPLLREIYVTILHHIERGQLANKSTIWPYFMNHEAVKSEDFFNTLTTSVLSISYLRDYAKQIRDMYVRRELFKLGSDLQVQSHKIELNREPAQIIEECETKLFKLTEFNETSGQAHIFSTIAHSVLTKAKESAKSEHKTAGIPTGFIDLDRHMGGLHPSDLIILAGRPSMGKTALATNIAFFVARSLNRGVLFFSLEMSDEQLATRILANEAQIPSDRIRRGMINQPDLALLGNMVKEISNIPLYIDDTPALTIAGLRTRARRICSKESKRGGGISLIIIDYLQLLSGGASENRVQELSFITRSLKAMAKELNLPIIALSQLSRAVEQREDRRPQLSDLRESGTIEQDADVVAFVYRAEYYEARNKPSEDSPKMQQWQAKMEKIHDLAELIIAKQRHGPIGTINLHYKADVTKFSNYINRDFDVRK